MTDSMKGDTKSIVRHKIACCRKSLCSLLTGVMLFMVGLCSVANASPGNTNNNAYGNLGGPDVTNPATQLIILTNNAIANGIATNSVEAHIVDALGNPVANQDVTFVINGGSGGINIVATTDAFGNAVITLTSTVAGTASITAKVNGLNIIFGSPALVVFVTGPVDVTVSLLSTLTTGAIANGIATNSVQAHVTDAFGNPEVNQSVVFAIASGTGTIVGSATVTTDALGNAVITLTSTVAGSVGITAAVGGSNITTGSPAIVVFVAGPPSIASPLTALSVVTNNALADGVATNSVQAHIADAFGNPVANQSVVFAIASGTGTIVGSATVTTDALGNAVITLTSTVAGSVGITATVGGSNITNGSPATVVFVAGIPSTGSPLTALSVVTNNAVADGVATNSVQAHITDAFGNPVANQSVVFAIASGTATIVGSATVTTDASGNAVITLTSTVAGSVGITATVGGSNITNGSPATVIFVVGIPSTSSPLTALSVVINNASANGIATNSVQAHITDANGNPVANQSVVFTIASGTGTIVGSATVTTDALGNALIQLTSTVADTPVDITATVNGSPIINGSPAIVIFTNKPDVTNVNTALFVVVAEATADGQATTSVKAHITDQNGNSIPGASVVFAIDSGSGQIITVQPILTDSNGDAIILITSTKQGFVLITAQVDSQQIVNGSPARVQFAAINIYVPKVFTPNGDGVNDLLKPILVGISAFHYFSVFNRWGNLVFTTEDPNTGWDGRFKGVQQPVETYLWIAEGVDTNGKKIVQKGMVSLVR